MGIIKSIKHCLSKTAKKLDIIDDEIDSIAKYLDGKSSAYLELCDSKNKPSCPQPKEQNDK